MEHQPVTAPVAATQRGSLYIWSISLVATLGGLLFGYDTAVISGAIGFLRAHFQLDTVQMGWAASSALVGCIAGAAGAGALSDRFGRKKTLVVSAILFAISAIGSALPQTIVEFNLYRIIGGVGVGFASMLSPLYIAEVAPARMRGRLVSVNQFAIVTGMLVVYFVNYFIALQGDEAWNGEMGWRWMFGSETVPALIFLVGLFAVPESPRWLLKQNRRAKAFHILARVDGEPQAREELFRLDGLLQKEPCTLADLFRPALRGVLALGIALAVLQQITGINVFLYYAPEIFKSLGKGTNAALLQTVIVGAVNLAFTIAAILVVDRLGRKPLMILGSAGMGVSLTFLGLAAYLQRTEIWVLTFMLTYIASFAIAIGPVTWVLLSEIFPTKVRGRAMAIATLLLWTANYIVSQTFPMLDEHPFLVATFHHGFAFWLYGAMCVVLILVVWRWVPETKGKSLEEIEQYWLSRSISK
jgi:SP family xylose:H+ symportor-like MFS transporter